MVVDRVSRASARHRARPCRDVRRAADWPILVFRSSCGIELSVADRASLRTNSEALSDETQPSFSLFPIADRERVELAQILTETEACIISVGRSTIVRLLKALDASDGGVMPFGEDTDGCQLPMDPGAHSR